MEPAKFEVIAEWVEGVCYEMEECTCYELEECACSEVEECACCGLGEWKMRCELIVAVILVLIVAACCSAFYISVPEGRRLEMPCCK